MSVRSQSDSLLSAGGAQRLASYLAKPDEYPACHVFDDCGFQIPDTALTNLSCIANRISVCKDSICHINPLC